MQPVANLNMWSELMRDLREDGRRSNCYLVPSSAQRLIDAGWLWYSRAQEDVYLYVDQPFCWRLFYGLSEHPASMPERPGKPLLIELVGRSPVAESPAELAAMRAAGLVHHKTSQHYNADLRQFDALAERLVRAQQRVAQAGYILQTADGSQAQAIAALWQSELDPCDLAHPLPGDARDVETLAVVDGAGTLVGAMIYNLGTGISTQNIVMARAILRLLDKPESLLQWVTDRPGHDRRYALDVSKVQALGWRSRHSFDEAITKTVRWYAGNEWWWRPITSGEHYRSYYDRLYGGREVLSRG